MNDNGSSVNEDESFSESDASITRSLDFSVRERLERQKGTRQGTGVRRKFKPGQISSKQSNKAFQSQLRQHLENEETLLEKYKIHDKHKYDKRMLKTGSPKSKSNRKTVDVNIMADSADCGSLACVSNKEDIYRNHGLAGNRKKQHRRKAMVKKKLERQKSRLRRIRERDKKKYRRGASVREYPDEPLSIPETSTAMFAMDGDETLKNDKLEKEDTQDAMATALQVSETYAESIKSKLYRRLSSTSFSSGGMFSRTDDDFDSGYETEEESDSLEGEEEIAASEEESKKILEEFLSDEFNVEMDLGNLNLMYCVPLSRIWLDQNGGALSIKLQVLNLGSNRLKMLPNGLDTLESLVELHLFSNKLDETCVPEGLKLEKLQKLQTLSLSDNRFKKLPLEFGCLKSLTHLDLHSNKITLSHDTRAVLLDLSVSLISLNLGFNKLFGTFDPGLCLRFTGMQWLSLQGNEIQMLPSSVKYMTSLKTLKLSGNPLIRPPIATAERGPEAVRQFFHSIDRVGSRMLNQKIRRRAEAQITRKEIVTDGEIDQKWSRTQPKAIVDSDIRERNIKLKGKEAEASKEESYAGLYAASCPTMPHTEVMQAGLNRMQKAPGSLSPPNSAMLSTIKRIQTKNIVRRNTTEKQPKPKFVQREIKTSTGPKNQGENEFVITPKLVEQKDKGKVQVSPFSKSRTSPSDNVSRHKSVESGMKNQIVPDKNPSVLDSQKSSIERMDIPTKAETDLQNGYAAVETAIERDYSNATDFSSGLSEDQDFNRTVKLIVVGSSGAGKTSMIQSMMNGKSVLMPMEIRTWGIDIFSWEMQSPESRLKENKEILVENNGPVCFSIWDFAGQEVYHGTHQFFLSRRALYILAWNVTKFSAEEIDEEVMFWIYSIQARVPGAVLQVVMTHTDNLNQNELDDRFDIFYDRYKKHEELRKLNLEMCMLRKDMSGEDHEVDRLRMLLRKRPKVLNDKRIAVSSSLNQGFGKLRRRLLSLALDERLFPHMGAKACIPRSWGIVEDCVNALDRAQGVKYIRWKKLLSKVRKCAKTRNVDVTEGDVSSAIDWMSDTGRVIRNESASGLDPVALEAAKVESSIIFLDPEWLVDLIKQLVDHNETSERTLLRRQASASRLGASSSRGARMARENQQKLHGELKRLRQEAILSEFLFPYLWPALFENLESDSMSSNDVVKHLLQVLQEFDICYEISTNPNNLKKARRSWLVPCLLTQRVDIRKHWYMEDRSSSGGLRLQNHDSQPSALDLSNHRTVELGRRYSFTTFSPPGLIGRILNKIFMRADDGSGRKFQPFRPNVWVDGAKFGFRQAGTHHQGFRLLVYLHERRSSEGFEPGYCLDLCARGDTRALIRMWEALVICHEAVDQVLQSYPGLVWENSVLCPMCKFQMLGTKAFAFEMHNIMDLDMEEVWEPLLYRCIDEECDDPTYGCEASMPCEKTRTQSEIEHYCPAVYLLPPPLEWIEKWNTLRGHRKSIGEGQSQMPMHKRQPYELFFSKETFIDARAVVKVGVYDRHHRALCQQGSGFIVDRHLGLVLTAAHLVMDPDSRVPKFQGFKLSVDENQGKMISRQVSEMDRYCFVIGTFVGEREAPEWKYKAVGVKYDVESHVGLDALVVRVSGLLEAERTHAQDEQKLEPRRPIGTICGTYGNVKSPPIGSVEQNRSYSNDQTTIMKQEESTEEVKTLLPLAAELEIGDSGVIRIHDRVFLVGYPARRGKSICCDSGHINQLIGHSTINCTAFQHDGSSGGPLINEEGKVIGLLSKGYRPGDFGQHIAINTCRKIMDSSKSLVAAYILETGS